MNTPAETLEILTTTYGTEVHLVKDLDTMLAILNNVDSWTQLENTFLCRREEMVGVFAFVGELDG